MSTIESVTKTETVTRPEPEWAAFVAIDWADQKHDWKLLAAGASHPEGGELNNTPEALEFWASGLHKRFQGRPIAVCLEQSRGPLVFRLMKYPHLVLYPVNTTTIKGFRNAFSPSGAKSDPSDSSLLLDVLIYHRHRLRRLDPDTAATRSLQMLVEERRTLVDVRTWHSNRLTASLKTYFPQMLDWMDDIDSPLSCALLLSWPTLQQLKRAHPGTLKKFFHQHNCRSEERIRKYLDAIYQATPAVDDAALLQTSPLIVTGIVKLIETLREQITVLDQQIEKQTAIHEDVSVFANLPGAGKVLLPRLIVAFGTNRDRWENAAALESFSGIAPVTASSGNSRWVHFRFACPKFVRQTFHEFATHSIHRSVWARAYYDQQIEKGKKHHGAVRALAFKWIRILFRCWKNHTPYDEAIYLRALEKHSSPLATLGRWESVGGFKKFSEKNA
jgi:transposase